MTGLARHAARRVSVSCAVGLMIVCAGVLGGCSATRPASSGYSGPALSPPQAEVARHLSLALDAARELGPGNPLLVSALHSSAAFYREQRRYAHAEALYRELLQIQEARTGDRHPDVALILEKYAALLRDANRLEDAKRLVARAQQIRAEHERRATPAP